MAQSFCHDVKFSIKLIKLKLKNSLTIQNVTVIIKIYKNVITKIIQFIKGYFSFHY